MAKDNKQRDPQPRPQAVPSGYIGESEVAQFSQIAGRPPTEWEIAWANSPDAQRAYGGPLGALQWQAQRLGDVARRILAIGEASGVRLDPAQAVQMRDSYLPSSGSSSDSEIGEAIQLATGKIGTISRDNLLRDTGLIPSADGGGGSAGGPSQPAVTEDHISTARRIVGSKLGAEYSDDDMVDFLAQQLAGGSTAFEIGQFLETTPQYLKVKADAENARVRAEAEAARRQVEEQSLRYEDEAFKRAQPQIIASYMRAGRLNSSGLDSALAKERARINQERQQYLSGLAYEDAVRREGYGREDFVNRNSQAISNYLRQSEPGYQQRFNLQNIGNDLRYGFPMRMLDRQFGLADQRLARGYETEDYTRQQNDYNRYLSDANHNARNSAWMGLAGSVLGAGLQGFGMGGFGKGGK